MPCTTLSLPIIPIGRPLPRGQTPSGLLAEEVFTISPLPTTVDDVARQARDLLLPIAQKKSYPAGTLLWREGDTAGSLVALERGRVKIYRVLPNGHAVTIYLFGPGDVFGFMPFLDGRPCPATAQALEDVETLVVRREALVAAFGSNPQLAMALIGLLARRLREAFDRIERVSVAGGHAARRRRAGVAAARHRSRGRAHRHQPAG